MKLCKDCAYCETKPKDSEFSKRTLFGDWICHHPEAGTSPLSGESLGQVFGYVAHCVDARGRTGICGLEARLFTPKDQ